MQRTANREQLTEGRTAEEMAAEDELRAQYARERADTWVRSPEGTPYGAVNGFDNEQWEKQRTANREQRTGKSR